jgi:FixJ family two-component response regulator
MLNKHIAAELGMSERTVRDRRALGMRKLGLSSAAELGRLFERLGEG